MSTKIKSGYAVIATLLEELASQSNNSNQYVWSDLNGKYSAEQVIASLNEKGSLGVAYSREFLNLTITAILEQGKSSIQSFENSEGYQNLGVDPLSHCLANDLKPLFTAVYSFLPAENVAWRNMSGSYSCKEFAEHIEKWDDDNVKQSLTEIMRIYRDILSRRALDK